MTTAYSPLRLQAEPLLGPKARHACEEKTYFEGFAQPDLKEGCLEAMMDLIIGIALIGLGLLGLYVTLPQLF
jgi:hypothetical protein